MSDRPVHAGGELNPELIEQARRAMSRGDVPGMAIGVLHDGAAASAGLGVTNIEHPLPVTGDTLFQIGSITKTFTVTALLQQLERGHIDLDDPIRRFIPDFAVRDADVSATVTLRDCMTHSCGWEGEFFANTGWGDDALAAMVGRMSELPQTTPIGQMWSYNNAAFYPLGRVLEVVEGAPFEQVIRRSILEPLELEGACFFAHELLHRNFAVGHTRRDGRTMIARPWAMPRSSNPVGGIVASVDHLLSYARFQLEGGTLLGDSLRLAAQRPNGPAADTPSVGLGWWLAGDGEDRVVEHGGGANGQPALLAMLPERSFAIAVLTNGSGGWLAAHELLAWVKQAYFGIEDAHATRLPESSLEDCTGAYETMLDRYEIREDDSGRTLSGSVLGDWLEDMDPPTSAEPWIVPVERATGDTLLMSPGTPSEQEASLLRRSDDTVGWLRLHRRAVPRVHHQAG
ncbi:serine hydrolase domain-containing protein [Micromonospora sp. NPDC048830]|uniref:serine hydrolase domain-containing protein n=1 Tax=Micromonospora sp. NPDC048830 TaxID=3364257 RepID=UPI00370FC2C8